MKNLVVALGAGLLLGTLVGCAHQQPAPTAPSTGGAFQTPPQYSKPSGPAPVAPQGGGACGAGGKACG